MTAIPHVSQRHARRPENVEHDPGDDDPSAGCEWVVLDFKSVIEMPCISQFYGIAIYMYYSDHAPPHFHAEYAGSEAEYSIDTLDHLEGNLPRRSQALVLEWAALHREELRENWERARNGDPLNQLDPLD